MTDDLSFSLPDLPNDADPKQHVITLLETAGLRSSDAQRLVADEMEITSATDLKNLTELMEGRCSESGEWIEASEESKTAGAKLAAFLQWNGITGSGPEALTQEEKSLVVVQRLSVAVRPGFVERVATYSQNEQQLLAVLKVFRPTVISAGVRNDGPDAKREKTRRLIAAAAVILGVTGITESE